MVNVTVRTKKAANNMFSLYLDYYPSIINPKTGKESRREFLKLKIHQIPKSELQKSHNTETLHLAELIRAKRLVQLRNREYGFKENINLDVKVVNKDVVLFKAFDEDKNYSESGIINRNSGELVHEVTKDLKSDNFEKDISFYKCS